MRVCWVFAWLHLFTLVVWFWNCGFLVVGFRFLCGFGLLEVVWVTFIGVVVLILDYWYCRGFDGWWVGGDLVCACVCGFVCLLVGY